MTTQPSSEGGQNPAYRPAHRQPGILSLGGPNVTRTGHDSDDFYRDRGKTGRLTVHWEDVAFEIRLD